MGALHGVLVTPLKVISDDRGQVLHFLRSDAAHFAGFGEVYFSQIYPGVVKGWKVHSRMVSSLTVPVGRVKFVLHDLRADSPTHGQTMVVQLADNAHALLTIPPGIAYGWKNLLPQTTALVANCANVLHEEGEAKNLPLQDIAYQW